MKSFLIAQGKRVIVSNNPSLAGRFSSQSVDCTSQKVTHACRAEGRCIIYIYIDLFRNENAIIHSSPLSGEVLFIEHCANSNLLLSALPPFPWFLEIFSALLVLSEAH
jgi:hypothetical protein